MTSRYGTGRSTVTPPDWGEFFAGYGAAVDWPVAAFWPSSCAPHPTRVVLLSVRDTERWWTSASHTIFDVDAPATCRPRSRVLDFAAGDDHDAARPEVHAGVAGRGRRRRPPTSATTTRCAPRCQPTGCSNGIPGTAGRRSAPRSTSPFPSEPFPHVNTTERVPGDGRARRAALSPGPSSLGRDQVDRARLQAVLGTHDRALVRRDQVRRELHGTQAAGRLVAGPVERGTVARVWSRTGSIT